MRRMAWMDVVSRSHARRRTPVGSSMEKAGRESSVLILPDGNDVVRGVLSPLSGVKLRWVEMSPGK